MEAGICMEDLKKSTQIFSEDSRFPGPDLNPDPYKRSWGANHYSNRR